jgi:hypothetical protein
MIIIEVLKISKTSQEMPIDNLSQSLVDQHTELRPPQQCLNHVLSCIRGALRGHHAAAANTHWLLMVLKICIEALLSIAIQQLEILPQSLEDPGPRSAIHVTLVYMHIVSLS